ncbi:hypothetical protein ASF48_17330 [Rathayibacter sp. Leaf299]|uniref:ribbon-helix-helix protein, CopG family n=1 Tax=Rathayibacter sp. Leaf299 TaxID=1736328 RepID=UPI000701B483|nr:ribbon-helix-helix protein, CopG family [Rathayibacter sp. Leaf299]KQQ18684.1 hypothetical protein ASF48_17330 [Rathayibacter sp. Leaf299]
MDNYDDLAARAERSELAPLPGTQLRGDDAAADARAALLAATGADTLDEAVTIARGRPRLDAEDEAGPIWKVRSTKPLDQAVRQLAQRRGVSRSQILREAAASYVNAAS